MKTKIFFPANSNIDNINNYGCEETFTPNDYYTITEKEITDWQAAFYKKILNSIIGIHKGPREALLYNIDTPTCAVCGKPIKDNEKVFVHHTDGNTENFLLSNLELRHVSCNSLLYNKEFNYPFVSVTKQFEFEAAHFLPHHYADCKYLHGHSYKLEVTVKRRVNSITGMCLDFKKLSEAVKTNVIDVFDHGFINDWLKLPTAENMLFWIWAQLGFTVKGISNIKLWETSSSFAELNIEGLIQFVKSVNNINDILNDTQALNHYSFIKNQQYYKEKVLNKHA